MITIQRREIICLCSSHMSKQRAYVGANAYICGRISSTCNKEQGCATVIVAACEEDERDVCVYKGESQHVVHCTCSQPELINF